MELITLEWEVIETDDDSRIVAMYCFKNCDKNQR
jgi:hypothetical protein